MTYSELKKWQAKLLADIRLVDGNTNCKCEYFNVMADAVLELTPHILDLLEEKDGLVEMMQFLEPQDVLRAKYLAHLKREERNKNVNAS